MMGVFRMLAIAVTVLVLAMMGVMSLFPFGLLQVWRGLQNGY
jgi:hypothetical protein